MFTVRRARGGVSFLFAGDGSFEFGDKQADCLDDPVAQQLVFVFGVAAVGEEDQFVQQLELLPPVEAWVLQHPAHQLGFRLFFRFLCDRLVDVVDLFVE